MRGLISVGVRHGDHVGGLMETRPPAEELAAALRHAPVSSILVDPENVAGAAGHGRRLLVLGGVGHVTMIDDLRAVADQILEATSAGDRS